MEAIEGIIKDQKQFDKFIDILPELKNDEVYFISLSARNKYLTKDERNFYSLGQTEMFGREIAQTKEKLKDYTIRKLEANLYSKRTRNGKEIPQKSLVCYMNVNPSGMVKSYFQFQKEMNRQISEITIALQNDKKPNYSFVNIQTRELMNCIQKSTGTKHFIDIDCDTKEPAVTESIILTLNDANIKYYIIETRGGYHFLIKKDTIPSKKNGTIIRSFNLQKMCTDAIKKSKIEKVEVMINGNAMVPVPGTMQSDFLVKLI